MVVGRMKRKQKKELAQQLRSADASGASSPQYRHDSPETRWHLEERIVNLTDTEHCRELINFHDLAAEANEPDGDPTDSG